MLSKRFVTRSFPAAHLWALAVVGFVATTLVAAAPLQAATWAVPAGKSGDWSISTNWGGGVPTSSSSAYMSGGTATITLLGAACEYLYVGDTSSTNSGTIQMSGGALTVSSAEYLGNNGPGTFIQTGGTNNFGSGQIYLGYGSSGGTYNLGGSGSLSGYDEWVGYSGPGTFIQSGGTNSLGAYGWLFLGVTGTKGTYSLSASGLLSAEEEYVGDGGAGSLTQSGGANVSSSDVNVGYFSGSSGTYTLSGGTHSIGGNLNLGYNAGASGSYYLSGGYLSATATFSATSYSEENVGYSGSGSFTQSGGTNNSLYFSIGELAGSSGTYSLSGNGYLSVYQANGHSAEYVGDSGTGRFLQTGGTNSCGYLDLGNGASGIGTYSLSGGYLSVTATFSATSYSEENVGYSGSGSFTQSGGTNNSLYFSIGELAGSSGTYSLSGNGYLSVYQANGHGAEYVGDSGTGRFLQTGGTNSCGYLDLGNGASGIGTYSLSGGYLSATATFSATSYSEENVGYSGSGSFTQSGGTNNSLYFSIGELAGSSGTYSLSGNGYLSVYQANGHSAEYVGDSGTGRFLQTGGTNSCGYLDLGNGASGIGTYSLSGGYLSATATFSATSYSEENVGYSGSGSFTQSGGTNNSLYFSIGELAGSSGTYSLSGNGYLSVYQANGHSAEYVGDGGTGLFLQTGGTNSCGYLDLGNEASGIGAYSLSGGSLYVSNNVSIGYSGTGSFTQTGGTSSVGNWLSLGNQPGSSGSYNLSGSGYLAVTNVENIGPSGTGTFTQTGGTNSCGTLTFGYYSSGGGTYNLNGGLLILSSLGQGAGTANFNVDGGTIQAGSPFSSSLPITLGDNNGGATVDTEGYVVTLSGTLSGPGSLTKVDSGTLILSGTNSYSGGTIVDAGTLVDASSEAIPDGTSLTVGPGATLVFDSTQAAGSVVASHLVSADGVVAVPEPGTIVLLAAGVIVGVGCWRRKGLDRAAKQ